MARQKERTTAIPVQSRRDPKARRYRSRKEREDSANRLALIIAGSLAGLILMIVLGAVVIDQVILPNQPVANVGGQNISTREFQRRVTFERWRAGTTLAAFTSQFGAQAEQFLQQSNNPYGQLYSQLYFPTQLGQQVLNEMKNDLLVQQYAAANNIKVDDNDVNKRIFQYFQYDPDPKTPTPTVTPSTTPTPLVSATPTSTSTPTVAPSMTATATVTPFPTGVPTVTPGATERRDQFGKNSKDYFQRAADATGLSEAEIRQIFYSEALREKVRETIVGKAPDEQEQVKARHILVQTEDVAKDVMAALQQGESFANLARSDSKDTGSGAQGGELGWVPKGQYVAEFDAALWNDQTKVGQVVGPIKTQFGFHIIQLTGREMRTLDEAQKQQAQDKKFQDWLTEQGKQRNATTFDRWASVQMDRPTLDQLGLPNIFPQSGSGFPGLPG